MHGFMLGDVQRFIGSLVESRRPSGARLVLAGVIGGAANIALADEMLHCPRPEVGIVAKSRSRVQFRIVISGCEFRRRKDCQTLAVFDKERRRHNDSHRPATQAIFNGRACSRNTATYLGRLPIPTRLTYAPRIGSRRGTSLTDWQPV